MAESVTKTVMVIEDNALNLKLFGDLLRATGRRVVENRDGRGVLEQVRAEKPDLILMDIQLPGVSGIDITTALKADPELKGIPVVAVTAFASKADEDRIRASGCDGYISKPIAVSPFLNEVQRFLEPL
ncbi:MAG TPA: response regulator [Magnetospirillaceae bacterium]|jgi:two-component system cell cycle response regulator DivK